MTGTSSASTRVIVPKESPESNLLTKIDLKTALQYGTAQGYPPLYSFLRQFAREHLHPNVPYAEGPEIILSCGATDGFSKTIEALSNVWDEERDWIREKEGILCEEFAYMNAIQAVAPRGLNVVPVAIDDEGMCASGKGGLAEVMENWDYNKGKRPHLMYTVT
jgi:DNA-binding transcriptional MocR family regulator